MSSSFLMMFALPSVRVDLLFVSIMGFLFLVIITVWIMNSRRKILALRPQSLFEQQLVKRIVRHPLTLRDKCLFRSFDRVEKQRRMAYYNHLNRFSQYF